MEMFQVGGFVRDFVLGRKSNDIDFTVVLSPEDFPHEGTVVSVPSPFEVMRNNLITMGFKIFLETPEYLTIRAQFPANHVNHRLTADFVLARKESGYTDGRRPDSVQIGTLEDDIRRRDFSMNALAMDARGNIIDLVGGVQDINDQVIRAVGNAFDRLNEDALRAVRALRFSVTLGFRIDKELEFAMQSAAVLDKIENNISDERIMAELNKMLAYDTLESLEAFRRFPLLTQAMFGGRVSIMSTMKERKGR